jgi:hypothetical protein
MLREDHDAPGDHAGVGRLERQRPHRDDTRWEGWLVKLKRPTRASTAIATCHSLGWADDPSLGRWVADQRRGKKKLDRGEPSLGMTAARAAKLEALGFAWEQLPARDQAAGASAEVARV